MDKINDNIVDISYQQTGKSSNTNELGMREMQAKAYEARNHRFLLIKAPPASGKSRALMFIALDKLKNQGIKKVVVAVPERYRPLFPKHRPDEVWLLRRLEGGATV